MCLALPGEVIALDEGHGTVDFGGVRRQVNLTLVPSVKLGDYVIVHAGFAIQILLKEEAESSLREWEDVFKMARIEDAI